MLKEIRSTPTFRLFLYICAKMRSSRHISNKVLTFSQWSRKNYAIFASLGKVVKIAHLSVDLCVSSILKSQPGIGSALLRFFLAPEKEDEEDSAIVQEMLQMELLPLAIFNSDNYQTYHKIINCLTMAHYLYFTDGGLFLFHQE